MLHNILCYNHINSLALFFHFKDYFKGPLSNTLSPFSQWSSVQSLPLSLSAAQSRTLPFLSVQLRAEPSPFSQCSSVQSLPLSLSAAQSRALPFLSVQLSTEPSSLSATSDAQLSTRGVTQLDQ